MVRVEVRVRVRVHVIQLANVWVRGSTVKRQVENYIENDKKILFLES